MKLGSLPLAVFLAFVPHLLQQKNSEKQPQSDQPIADATPVAFWVFGASAEQEAVVRSQIQVMQPEVLPMRIFFVPHWKYVSAAKAFRLRVPKDMSSVMFTHLPSRTVFIDNGRYLGAEWLGYWMAHELGHLAANSVDERLADKAARLFRKRLQETRNKDLA